MIDLRSVKGLCRCCHSEGQFKSLGVSDNTIGVKLPVMIRETFEINIVPLPGDIGVKTYRICAICKARLLNAALFKKQVAACEEKLAKYYSECKAFIEDVKLEEPDPLQNTYNLDKPLSVRRNRKGTRSDKQETDNHHSDTEKPSVAAARADMLALATGTATAETTDIVLQSRAPGSEDQPMSVVQISGRKRTDLWSNNHHNETEEPCAEVFLQEVKVEYDPSENCEALEEPLSVRWHRSSTDSDEKGTDDHHSDTKELHLEDQPLLVVRKSRRNSTVSDERGTDDQHSDAEEAYVEVFAEDVKLEDDSPENAEQINPHEDDSKKYSCNICWKKYKYIGALAYHMKMHTGEYRNVCQMCNIEFRLKNNLKKHFKEKHYIDEKYICTVCGKQFDGVSLLKKHIKYHFDEKFKCTYCSKEFHRNALKVHLKSHTGEKYVCEVCNKSFTYKHTYKYHMLSHSGECQTYVCDDCGRQFSLKHELTCHIIANHTALRQYTCSVCNKQFSAKWNLKKHEWLHRSEKPYSCEVCKKGFATNSDLETHMRVHTGAKPYKCTYCGKQFSQGQVLKAHMRTHTGEKPFSCKVCNTAFAARSNLKRHMEGKHRGDL